AALDTSYDSYTAHRALHSFPTRRSSDLAQKDNTDQVASATTEMAASAVQVRENAIDTRRKSEDTAEAASKGEHLARAAVEGIERSEEHTSELQSRENLVCRLLLEKKNNM